MRIFLIGFMGSGKSHYGKKLARLLNYPFIDLDQHISTAHHLSITDIFKNHGEEYFREQEKNTLRELIKGWQEIVIGTGGGTPCFHNNMQMMNENGVTVYLKGSPTFLFHRVLPRKDSRPLMSGLNDTELMNFIESKLQERSPMYEQAKIIVDAKNITAKELMEKLKSA
jgi:shikimate kinase